MLRASARPGAAVVPRVSASMVVTAPISGPAEASAYNYRVLMVRRAEGGNFESALVFPGGVEEAGDCRDASRWKMDKHKICAIRETFEETGLLLTTTADRSTQREFQPQAEPSFSAMCEKHGVRPLDLRLIGRWITPRAKRHRFDTRFFMLNIGDTDKFLLDQLATGQVQLSELVAMDWLSPDEILRANARSQTALFPPQFYILTELARFKRWQDLASYGSGPLQSPIEPVLCPRSDGKVVALLPGDRAYPVMGDCERPVGSGLAVCDADLFGEDRVEEPAGMHRIVMTPANTAGGFYAATPMRFPFSIHKGFKSSDNFVKLASDNEPLHANTVTEAQLSRVSLASEQPRRAGSPGAGRDRGMSASSYMVSPTQPQPQQRYSRGRPMSAVFAQSPMADLHLAQIEEELDTIMDEMGLQAEQRLPMKNMSLDSKIQLIQTHKAKTGKGHRADATPLSEHLKILTKAGTQSLPRARLEKLRVDIAYQSVQQLGAFIDDGGLRLLLTHLTQLNERRTATRRQDELLKEREILCCILGMAKVSVGARFLLEGNTAHLRHILDSVGTLWMPCAVMSLRIISYLAQQQDSVNLIDVIIASLFRRESAAADDPSATSKRSTAFVEWMQAIDHAIEDYDGAVRAAISPVDQQQAIANAVELVSSSLVLANSIVDALSGSIDKRVKFYERLCGHDMLTKFARLRAWQVSVINAHLGRWEEALRRDYNIARSQRADVIVLDSGGDSTIRDMTLFKSFIAHYQEAKAAESNVSAEGSDADDEFLKMNLSTYSPQSASPAPATPAAAATAKSSRPVSIADDTSFFVNGCEADDPAVPPFMARNRSRSNIAETGSLRNLRAAPNSHPGFPPASAESSDLALVGLKSTHSLLKRAFLDMPRLSAESSSEAIRELRAIVELAQSMLATFD
ncbi:hypothetical protein IWW37_003005 [Coemansia sp. RSA 2050]|nr:hypothetical protein IWW37_003005 [Coemansia sp. RSA 2050]KAJ2733530.1 hypothetical protein IW152_002996 [Coemansia sp. BCRC 34962]